MAAILSCGMSDTGMPSEVVPLPKAIQHAVRPIMGLFSPITDENGRMIDAWLSLSSSLIVRGWSVDEISSSKHEQAGSDARRARKLLGFRFATKTPSSSSNALSELARDESKDVSWVVQPVNADGQLRVQRAISVGGGWVGGRFYESLLVTGGVESVPAILLTENGEIAGVGLCVSLGGEVCSVIRHGVRDLLVGAQELLTSEDSKKLFDVSAARGFCAREPRQVLAHYLKALPITVDGHGWSFEILLRIVEIAGDLKGAEYALGLIPQIRNEGAARNLINFVEALAYERIGRKRESAEIMKSLLGATGLEWRARAGLLRANDTVGGILNIPVGVYPLPRKISSPIAGAELGLELLRYGRYEDAAKLLRPISETRGVPKKFIEAYASALYLTGRYEDAINELERVVLTAAADTSPSSRLLLAQSYQKTGQLESSVRVARYVRGLLQDRDESDSASLTDLVELLAIRALANLTLMKSERASSDALEALRLGDESGIARIVLCRLAIERGDLKDFETHIRPLESRHSKAAARLRREWNERLR